MNRKNLRYIMIYTLIIMLIMAVFTLLIGPINFKRYSDFLFYGSLIAILLSTISFFSSNERKKEFSLKLVKEQEETRDIDEDEKVDKKNKNDIREFGYRMFIVFFILIILSRYVYYI